jgi:magnesium-protoporphyrin O-methyltransferase
MSSCHCASIEKEFGQREARAQQRRYRRGGPAGTTAELISVLASAGVAGGTVLDIGGGVGAIQHGLLAAGARRATSVEASQAYLEVAAEEARRLGLSERIRATHGDFVELAEGIEPADFVTLDRVLCCYPDMQRLVIESARRARRFYGLVYPRDAWWLRPAFAMGNLLFRLRGSSFRIFLHSTEEIEAIVRAQGLQRTFHRLHGMWQVAVFAA